MPFSRPTPYLCAREESNPYHKLRKLASYPLNDERIIEYQVPAGGGSAFGGSYGDITSHSI